MGRGGRRGGVIVASVARTDADRSSFADALRAFALVGICVVNLPQLAAPPIPLQRTDWGLDAAAQFTVSALLESKFFLLFSFLFGFGFANQLRRIEAGSATPASFGRRLAGLLAFGAAHATFLFVGDILMLYAVLGCALWRSRRWPDGRLLRRAVILTAVFAVLCLALGAALAFGPDSPPEVARDAEIATRAYRDGTFVDAMRHRLAELLPVFPVLIAVQGPPVFAAFCVGLVAGRHDLLRDPARLAARLHPYRGRLLMGAVIGNLIYAATPWLAGPAAVVGYAALAAAAPCLSALYVLGLIRLWTGGGRGRALLDWAGSAGRMSLTNYLGQSLAANILFMGWGFGLYGQLGLAALLLIAVATALGLLAASAFWLRHFAIGPCEWMLRYWTVLRRPRFRR